MSQSKAMRSNEIPIGTIFKATLKGVWSGGAVRGVFLKLNPENSIIRISPQYTGVINTHLMDIEPTFFSTGWTWGDVEFLEVSNDE